MHFFLDLFIYVNVLNMSTQGLKLLSCMSIMIQTQANDTTVQIKYIGCRYVYTCVAMCVFQDVSR